MLLPIHLGQSDFTQLRQRGGLYIDKTGFVSTVITNPALVQLYPRPRRFGKTLNLSTVQAFLEQGPDKSGLFEGLNVWNDPQARPHFQKYPVICLSFKDVKERSWEEALVSIQSLLRLEIGRLQPLWKDASDHLETTLRGQLDRPMQDLLRILCIALHQSTGQPVVLLIDEYDTPLLTAWENDYFEDAVSWFRSFLSAGLKDNAHLFRGVLTGILWVARENLFSGLNNVIVKTTFLGWMKEGLAQLDPLHRALLTGDALAVEELLGTLLLRHVSTWDLKDTQDEAFYHAFVLGLLVSMEKTHSVQSNREVGRGRADVQLAPKGAGKRFGIAFAGKKVVVRAVGS